MIGIKVDLTIKDHSTGAYLVVPVLPERIEYADGEKLADTVTILNLGDVDFLSGVALDTFGWSSDFPARYDPAYCVTSNLRKPLEYRNQFSSWKDAGTPLQLICPAAGINKRMYLKTFTWDLRGAEGDIYYSVGFTEKKDVKPKKLVINVPPPPKGKKTTAERPKAEPKPKPKTYTVKKGDYLIKIAKAQGIKNWRTQLYEPNKKPKGPLGSNPDLIYPGQVLKLP